MTRARLSNDMIFSLSSAIGETFRGQEIKKHFADYSVKHRLNIDLPSMKEGESKSKYSKRLFRCFDAEEQAGLIVYLTEQDESLKQEEAVKNVLYQLAETYGIVTEIEEERERLTEMEYLLSAYPDSLGQWKIAMSYYQAFQYRESLDNARLCLELLLKFLLNNDKSLENQKKIFCSWLGKKDVPNEVVNMVWKRLDDYTSIQNNHAKHNLSEKLTTIEVRLILDETYSLIKYLVNRAKEVSHD